MTFTDIAKLGGGGLLVLLSLIQISPIKWNPWTRIANAIGRAINGEVLKKLEKVEADVKETRQAMEQHEKEDKLEKAESSRKRVLRFNDEVMRGVPHSKEHFVEVLGDIDKYERYCATNDDYENSRAVMAISNIERVYKDRLEKNDFLT